jgi:hypothetical protein
MALCLHCHAAPVRPLLCGAYCGLRCAGLAALPLAFDEGHGDRPAQTPAAAARDPNADALLLRAHRAIMDGTAERVFGQAPPHVHAWAIDRVALPSVAVVECRGGMGPLRRIPGAAEAPLACVVASESDQDFSGSHWLARTQLFTTPLYALMGARDVDVPLPSRSIHAAGYALWSEHVPGAPTEDDMPLLVRYAADLGRAMAQLHYGWLCDGRGLAVTLAHARREGEDALDAVPRLYVSVDTSVAGHVPPGGEDEGDGSIGAAGDDPDDAVRECLAASLARGAWTPLVRTADTTRPRVRLDEAFRAAYVTEAGKSGRATLAQDTLTWAESML